MDGSGSEPAAEPSARTVGRRDDQERRPLAEPVAGKNLVVAGADVASGTSQARVDRDGNYAGVARCHDTGIRTASVVGATVRSLIRAVVVPGAEPRISYELSLGGLDTADSRTHLERDEFTLSGTDVPVSELRAQFNTAVRANSAALAALGPAGFALLEPEVRRDRDGLTVTAPALTTNAGLALRRGDLGQNVSVIFGFASVLIGPAPSRHTQ